MLTLYEKAIIKETIPLLKKNGVELATHFYDRMLRDHPELKNVFNMGNQGSGKQQIALAMAILSYAEHIDEPEILHPSVNKIGHKHRSLNISPEQYKILGKYLILSIRELMGQQATQEILSAWEKAYDQLASMFIEHEKKLYEEVSEVEGGWKGWRSFVVKRRIDESEDIASFYLYPEDGGIVADFIPGQYVSIQVYVDELELFQSRQYSLSNAPNGRFYRVSVKKESGTFIIPDGMISSYLYHKAEEGTKIELTAPAGDFILLTRKKRPLVFMSGGIGQTPFISMLERLAAAGSKRKIVWVHACRKPEVHAFKDKVNRLLGQLGQEEQIVFYEEKGFQETGNYYQGRIDYNSLKEQLIIPTADYYICGPRPFIEKQYLTLKSLGIKAENIYYEEFGPHVLSLK